MDANQLRQHIIIPTLKSIDLYSKSAEELIIFTAAAESNLGQYIHQINGPALGIYQCEPATHKDILANYLAYRPELYNRLKTLLIPNLSGDANLIGNLYYATAICRIHYRRVPEKIPNRKNIEDIANYWKKYYNTFKGKGVISDSVYNYKKLAM